MKLLIAGSSVEDMIHTKGTVLNQPGGMFYVASAVDALREENDEIFMLTNLSQKQRHLYFPLYERFNSSLVNTVEQLPVNHLFIHEKGEREEKYEHLTEKISFEPCALENLDLDGVLINLITGFDFTPSDIKRIKAITNAPVFLDIHSRTRSFSEEGKREFSQIDDINEWASTVDILQANENEILYCGSGNEEKSIVENILNLGVKFVLVTKGDAGVRMYYRNNGETNSLFVKALQVESVNKVGCGDVFGATFFINWLRTNDPVNALYAGNAAGAVISTYKSTKQIENLKKDVDSLLYEK